MNKYYNKVLDFLDELEPEEIFIMSLGILCLTYAGVLLYV